MFQRQSPFHSRDDAAMDQLGNRLTNGTWSIVKHSMLALIEANALLISVFLRKRQGILQFSVGKIFWLAVWIGIALILFWENGKPLLFHVLNPRYDSSWNPLWFHVKLTLGVFLLKWLMATFSIGSEKSRFFRARDAMGTSILWPVFAWFLRWLKLACKKGEKPRFFQLSARRWMLMVEPMAVLLFSMFLHAAGVRAYGNILFLAGLAFTYTTFRQWKNRDMEKQMNREAEIMG